MCGILSFLDLTTFEIMTIAIIKPRAIAKKIVYLAKFESHLFSTPFSPSSLSRSSLKLSLMTLKSGDDVGLVGLVVFRLPPFGSKVGDMDGDAVFAAAVLVDTAVDKAVAVGVLHIQSVSWAQMGFLQ